MGIILCLKCEYWRSTCKHANCINHLKHKDMLYNWGHYHQRPPPPIKPDFRCTQIIRYYLNVQLKRGYPPIKSILHCRRGGFIKGRLLYQEITSDLQHVSHWHTLLRKLVSRQQVLLILCGNQIHNFSYQF